ncbi:MAG: hypothetical protein DMD35_10170 [Gemmatimonadetes bacterium]|nr:MAG: hypothetical protein DMD35_10170 [Gemmatimonadota bacterium]
MIPTKMDTMTLRLMLGGLKSYFPVLHAGYRGAVGHTTGAYCYSVWMRHLSIIMRAVPTFAPRVVVELGPGDSLGLGCAALLSVADQYIGLDVVEHADPDRDLKVLDELVDLFEHHAPIPDERVFPNLEPKLQSYRFPNRLFTDDGPRRIRLDPTRLDAIRAALVERQGVLYDNMPIGYTAPWGPRTLDRQSVDLVITQAALQDIGHEPAKSELAGAFQAMSRWLKKGGVMSHQINFAFPGYPEWNHHWRYSDAAWRLVRGHRPFFENRVSLSTYLALCEENDFEVVSVKRVEKDGIPREKAAPRFQDLPEQDFRTSSAHIVAVRR